MIINNIKFKNFLSFGNTYNTIEYKNGINVILGKDVDGNKSNGSGKSSAFVDTLSFVFFGQTTKQISQARIINTINKKNCEVIVEFQKNNNNYKLLRALKPNKLELYCNDVLVDPPTHKKEFQSYIENEIIGLDFKTYKMLVFLNLNNQRPILDIPRAEKRQFLEKMFDLSLFTKLNEACNKKIKNVTDKLKDVEDKILVNVTKIEMYKDEVDTYKTINFDKVSSVIVICEENLKVLIEIIKTLEENYNTKLEKFNNIKDKLTKALETINIKINVLKTNIKNITKEIEKEQENEKEYNEKRNKYLEYLDKNSLEEVSILIQKLEEEISSNEEKLNEIYNIDAKTETKIETKSVDLKDLSTLKDHSKCPMCGNPLDKEHQQKEIERLTKEINELNDILTQNEKQKKLYISKGKEIKTELTEKQKIEKNIMVVKTKLESLKEQDYELLLNDLNTKKDKYIKDLSTLEEDYLEKNNELKELKDDELKELLSEIKEKNNEVNDLKLKIVENKNILKKKERVLELNTLIENINVEQSELEKERNKYKIYNQYFKYIKDICSDEEVKSYAIGNAIPFITKKLNEYISTSGHPFYVELNDWLEAEFKGIGISNYDYGNLSSGEARAVDLSLQFSFLDLSKLQMNDFPDILFLDEILDGSIDNTCLDGIIDIVKKQQLKYKNKVYIISHRDNLKNIDADNYYLVEKKNGFSNIKLL